MTDRPPRIHVFEKEAIGFADRWSNSLEGPQVLVKTCNLAFDVGRELKMDRKKSALLAEPLRRMFEQEGYTPRAFFRAGLFIASNIKDLRNGVIPQASLSGETWVVIHITDMADAGRNSRGRKLWAVTCLIMTGPLAGTEFTTNITDGFLAAIVRSVSGAKYSRTVSGCDAFGMRLKANIGKSGTSLSIISIDDTWADGRKRNSELRKAREDCRRYPCDKCNKGLDRCPYAIRRFSIERQANNGVPPSRGPGLHEQREGSECVVSGSGTSSSDSHGEQHPEHDTGESR